MPDSLIPLPRRSRERIRRRVETVVEFADYLAANDEKKQRTEALRLARAIALAGLPKKRAQGKRDFVRDLRLGQDLWLRVTYSVALGREMPFGEDRFVLAAIQHLAIETGRPTVYFERVGQLLEMFGVLEDGRGYRRLRERFRRLASLSISFIFGKSKEELAAANCGEQIFVIRQYALPTREDLQAEAAGQLTLHQLLDDSPDASRTPFGVVLSEDFWKHLREASNQMIVPIQLLKLFIDRPVGWDYLMFLVARCGRAQSPSIVDHQVLMSLFKDSEQEPDRKTIARLQQYHTEIMLATGNRLNAELIQVGDLPHEGAGRRRKRWALRVGPSKQLVWPGQQRPLLSSEDPR